MVSTRGRKEADRQDRDRVRLLLLHSRLVHRRAVIFLHRLGVLEESVPQQMADAAMEGIHLRGQIESRTAEQRDAADLNVILYGGIAGCTMYLRPRLDGIT